MLVNLGCPRGLPSAFNRVRPFGINDSRAIVGAIYTPAGEIPSRAFVHRDGGFTVLSLVQPTDLAGAAIGINDRGEVVGFDRTSDGGTRGWRWLDGAYSSLPVAGENTVAVAINSSGTIVGYRRLKLIRRLLAGQYPRAREMGYVLRNGRAQYLDGPVHAINDGGVAAGASVRPGKGLTGRVKGEAIASVVRDGSATLILGMPSAAFGINSAGEVVGSYREEAGSRAFVWSPESGAFNVTPPGYQSAVSASINDRGEILGYGETVTGASMDFLLTPDPGGEFVPTPVPAASG